MRDIKAVLEGYGLDLSGWALTEARSISTDGQAICGMGKYTVNGTTRREGWVATIGRPGPAHACCHLNATTRRCFGA